MAQLFIVQGDQLGQRFDLKGGRTVIGRDVSCDFRIKDVEISRRHLEIRREGRQYRALDLGSSNGTMVNSESMKEAWLKRGDRIAIGQTVLIFQDDLAIQPNLATMEQIRIVGAETGDDKSAIVQTLPATGDLSRVLTGTSTPHWLHERLSSLDVIYKASREIGLITDLSELLPRILELVFDSIGADRGAILLLDSRGVMEPRAVRCRGTPKKGERLNISHSIVDHVLSQGQGVICTDTLSDSRFSEAQSVMKHGIREAVCVPLQGRHSILGVIYADHRSAAESGEDQANAPVRRFSQDHLSLMVSIGNQAGLAVENSSLYQAKLNAERLAAIGQTITIVSHHVKNVLQGLKGGSSLIQTGLDSGDLALAKRGQVILERNLGRVYDLVLDMLSYAKSREPVREEVNVAMLIEDLVELMKPRAESQKVRLEMKPIEKSLYCWLDEEGIHRAVLNLITNAMDALAGKEGGYVEVGAEFDSTTGLLKIRVMDNGPGIAEEEINHIFELFESTKGSKGTGLGLPVCDKIVREHGGKIEVESQMGVGTSFVMSIPNRIPQVTNATPVPGLEATHSGSSIVRARSLDENQ